MADEVLRGSSLGGDVGFLAAKFSAHSARVANRLLDEHGLRVRSYSALVLATGDAPVTQRHLAEALSLDPSQIVTIVDGLETDGLVRREVDPADRRSRVVTATTAGRARCREAARTVAEVDELLLASLGDAERDALRAALQKLVFGD